MRIFHNAAAIGHKAGWDWQFPFGIAVGIIKIDSELTVDPLQVVWKSVDQIKRPRLLIVLVVKDIKIQTELADQFAVERLDLRRDSHHGCRTGFEVVNNFVKSFQLYVAVRSPHTAEKCHDQRPLGQKFIRPDHCASRTNQ